jgi:hypothetical protein
MTMKQALQRESKQSRDQWSSWELRKEYVKEDEHDWLSAVGRPGGEAEGEGEIASLLAGTV